MVESSSEALPTAAGTVGVLDLIRPENSSTWAAPALRDDGQQRHWALFSTKRIRRPCGLQTEGPSNDLTDDCEHGRPVYFQDLNCGAPVLYQVPCNKRFDSVCPPCSKRWRTRLKWRYYDAALAMKAPKFVTLTLRKMPYGPWRPGVPGRLRMIWRCRQSLFLTLRRRGYVIRSWVAVIEPPNHMHLIVDCEYIPKHEFVEIWHRVTGDSFIVDIRAVNAQRDPRQVLDYLTKYVGKVTSWKGINLDLLEGFKLCFSHGTPHREIIKSSCPNCLQTPDWLIIGQNDYYALLSWFMRGRRPRYIWDTED